MSEAVPKFIKRRNFSVRNGPIVAIEYPLPSDSMPKITRKRIDPWLAACVGCEPDEIRNRLKQRWSDLDDAGLGGVARFFRRLAPYSILANRHAGWLMVRDRPNETFDVGREWFLPPPTSASDVVDALSKFQIRKGYCLEVFLREFAGFREELPNVSGFFPRVQDWLPFQQYVEGMGWNPQKVPRVWASGAVIYESLCGDVIVLDRIGRLAWWDHDDDRFRILCKDFQQFPVHWLKYLRKNYPFSPWDPG